MKVWIILTVLGSAFLGSVECQECPSGWFNVSFAITVDTIIAVAEFMGTDSELNYFRETLKLTEEETQQVTQGALEFYNTTYGLNFFNSPIDATGQRQYENATMIPFEVPFDVPVTQNRWIVNGKQGVNRCFFMREGGYTVRFSGEQIVRGTYGGPQGRLLRPESAEGITYVLFNLNVCPHQPLFIITCESSGPLFRNPDFFAVRRANCYNRQLGHGLLQGAQGTVPTDDPDKIHLTSRTVINFPSHPDSVS